VTVDVVCGGPVFLDLTFEGLEGIPGPGEERFARDLHTSPGGAAITAVGLVRLGLSAAIVAPLGRDLPGAMLRERLEAAGVVCAGGRTERTPVAAVLPVDDDRAIATFEPPGSVEPETIARLAPRALVVPLDELELAPEGLDVYANVGERAITRHELRLPDRIGRVRALFANRDEALRLTRAPDAEAAALMLAEAVETAVVTCGADGAVAAAEGEIFSVPAPRVATLDTTGAGDLFVAAYLWGELAGLPLAERLRHAAVYAALSVRSATGAGSAATIEELERALAELDPAIVQE
jgi:sugar/nucleoside kinase (ribokinase family)